MACGWSRCWKRSPLFSTTSGTGLKQPGGGRHGLTATQVLRSLVLMRLKNWDYRELRERIADGLTLRQFTDFYCAPVPKHDAFQRGFIRLTPQTLKAVNDLVVRAAVELGLEDGAKLRVDTTVVQTTFIIQPTTRCYGMWSASSHAWSAVWPKRWNYDEIKGVLRPHTLGAAADVRDPAHDDEAASRAADPHGTGCSSTLPRRS